MIFVITIISSIININIINNNNNIIISYITKIPE